MQSIEGLTFFFYFSGELFLAFVTSSEQHAEITDLDLDAALAQPGIHGFLDYKDPKDNNYEKDDPYSVVFAAPPPDKPKGNRRVTNLNNMNILF